MNSFNLFALISFWTIIAASCRSLPINSFRTLSSLNKKSSYPFEIPHGNHIVRIEIKKKNGKTNGYGVRSIQTLKGANGLKILITQNNAVLDQSTILPLPTEDSALPSPPEKTVVYGSTTPILPIEEPKLEESTVSPLQMEYSTTPVTDDSAPEDSTTPILPIEELKLEESTVSPLQMEYSTTPVTDDSASEDSTTPILPPELEESTVSPLQMEYSTTPVTDDSAPEDSTTPILPIEEPELEQSTEPELEKTDLTTEDSTLPSLPVEEKDDQEKDYVDSSEEDDNEPNDNVELTTAVQESSESEESEDEDENSDNGEDSHDDGHHDNLADQENATESNEEESPIVNSQNDENYYDYNHEINSKENLQSSVYVYNYDNNHEPVRKANNGFFESNQIALPQPKVAFESNMRTQDIRDRFRSPIRRQKRPERLSAARASPDLVSSQFRPHPLRDTFATRLFQLYSPVLFG